MEEPFNLPVNYNGVEKEFETILLVLGYTHKFQVDVEGTPVLFERDEEGRYRAIITPDYRGRLPKTELLQSIALAIEEILS
jgi:hypothetical protein